MIATNLAARLAAAAGLFVLPGTAHTAVILTGSGYAETFDTLIASGTATVANVGTAQNPEGALPNGWRFRERGGNADLSYAAGTGSANSGNTYSFGATGSSDRALGTLASGSLQSAIGVIFTNATGATITGLDVAFLGEQWRAGGGGASRLSFEYRVGGADLQGSTGWLRFDALDVLSSVTGGSARALDGNLDANRTRASGLLDGLSIADGGTIAFRWSDEDDAGADHALAIDDFSLTVLSGAAAVPEPTTWAMMIGGFGLVGGAMRRRDRTRVIA